MTMAPERMIGGPAGKTRLAVLDAFKWSILGEAASRMLGPVTFLILARLLAPTDFGVVAAATVVTSLCQAIADLGMGKALIQRERVDDADVDAAFWASLLMSCALTVLLVAAAPAVAGFFGDARIGPVVCVLALQMPAVGLSTVPSAMLQRNLAFRELFWVRLLTACAPAVAAIPLALGGHGYWALVVGVVVGQVLQCVVLWARSSSRPRGRPHPRAIGQLVRFGRWAGASALLAWCYAWLDALFVARYLGTHDMGLYRIGNTFVAMAFGLVLAPLLPVLYSLFSRGGGGDVGRVAASLEAAARAIIMVSLPIAALVAVSGSAIQDLVLGSQWTGIGPVLAMLAIGHGFAWLVGANGEAYRAIGRPELETRAMGLALLIYVVAYAVSVQYGLLSFVATRAGLVLIGMALQIGIAAHALGLAPRTWVRACLKPAAFSCVAAAMALSAKAIGGDGPVVSTIAASAFVATYVGLLWADPGRPLEAFSHAIESLAPTAKQNEEGDGSRA